ncbi:uncharacterized protein LOC111136389 [Crassostrea virginica]|uniref:Amyloid beta A4 protein-like n=1 Tax=Crassostrea virginica TaxID=6565 RepID=A0A8B8ESJ1_CRAVI|nr:amyloid beta A4 protein-like [Crassostrea virginica]
MREFILCTCLCILLFGGQVTTGSSLDIGPKAKRKCKEANKSCSKEEVCAIQHLQWPMNMSFPVCVPAKYVRVKMRICDLPPQPGDCGARYQRWFYNKNIKECMIFTFQGCRGNQNNFRSKDECEENCIAYFDQSIQKSETNFQPVRSPRIVTERLVGDQAIISTSPLASVRARVTDPHQKELRRKRRLERKKLRQLKRSRKKGKKKRRRDGKGKKKRKNRKKNKKRRRKNKNKKNRRRKNKLKTTTVEPTIDLSNADAKSKANSVSDFELISILDKTKDTMKNNIEKIKAQADRQKEKTK